MEGRELVFSISAAAMRRPKRRASAFRELLRRWRALLPGRDPKSAADFWSPLLRGSTIGLTWNAISVDQCEATISVFRRIRGLDVAWRVPAERAAS